LQVELLNRRRWKTLTELAAATHDYTEHFHNTRRRHSAHGMRTQPKPKPALLSPGYESASC
jgi:putative transposase